MVARLAEALDHPEDHDAAASAISGLVERIVLTPGEKWAEVDAVLHCDLGAILEWAGNGRENRKTKSPCRRCRFRWLRGQDSNLRPSSHGASGIILPHPSFPAGSLAGTGMTGIQQVPADAPGDPGSRAPYRVPGKVGVARGGLDLRVADHQQSLSERRRSRGVAMAEVMNAHVVQSGARGCGARGLAGPRGGFRPGVRR